MTKIGAMRECLRMIIGGKSDLNEQANQAEQAAGENADRADSFGHVIPGVSQSGR